MIYHLIAQLVWLLLDLFTTKLRSEQEKDLEILLLPQMERSAVLRVLQRHNPKTPHISRWVKLDLAVLAARFTALGRGAKTKLNEVLLLFKPDTPWLCREPWR